VAVWLPGVARDVRMSHSSLCVVLRRLVRKGWLQAAGPLSAGHWFCIIKGWHKRWVPLRRDDGAYRRGRQHNRRLSKLPVCLPETVAAPPRDALARKPCPSRLPELASCVHEPSARDRRAGELVDALVEARSSGVPAFDLEKSAIARLAWSYSGVRDAEAAACERAARKPTPLKRALLRASMSEHHADLALQALAFLRSRPPAGDRPVTVPTTGRVPPTIPLSRPVPGGRTSPASLGPGALEDGRPATSFKFKRRLPCGPARSPRAKSI